MIETRLLAILLCVCVRSQRSLTEPDSLPSPLAEPQTISNGSCSHESRTISDGENITVTEKIGCSKFTCRNSVLNRLYDGCMYEEECYPFNFTFQGNKGDCFLYRCVTGSYHDKYGAYHETIERVKVSPLCKDINGHCWKRGQTFTSLSQDGDKRFQLKVMPRNIISDKKPNGDNQDEKIDVQKVLVSG
ncbi:hypothetical protein RRG08_001240 [Elysia crispata]|uniref:Secreted protein n=1 Tax=Elysia crispata TaxID=231223 RepID=A0AAE1B7F1_9GAST|nr:hypothetical protein RRG08_001240 [Elysia crispata]